jgi:hypothetical protein
MCNALTGEENANIFYFYNKNTNDDERIIWLKANYVFLLSDDWTTPV